MQEPERAPASGADDLGLDLPAWKVWIGIMLLVGGVAVGGVAGEMTMQLAGRWDVLADPAGDLVRVVLRWGVAIVLLVAGIILSTANGRARARAARATLRQVR
ncbi:MAG TPA: hypothetical protein VFC82_10060 [Actinomycetaceae bacterium]|nr:hypothetical protein [Actinomycetaceae bacterium]